MSDPFAKPRADSTLAGQSPVVQAALDDYAQDHTLEETRAWLKETHAITISAGALSTHLRRRRLLALKLRMDEAQTTATDLATSATALNAGPADDALFAALRTRILDLLSETNANPKDIRALLQLIIAARKTEQDDRRIALLEKRAALADTAETLAKSADLTPEEKATQLRALFGMG